MANTSSTFFGPGFGQRRGRAAVRTLLPCVALLGGLAATQGCVAAREATLVAENVGDGPVVKEYPWGRVECGRGAVCSEVSVSRVDVHSGPVAVTLENRTLNDVAVQVALETFDTSGGRTDLTNYQDLALAPRSKSVLTLWQELDRDEKLVIHLRPRS